MFKVGDWVKYEKGKDFETARVEIVGQIPNYVGVSTGENVHIDDCEFWKPQEGEWIVQYNNFYSEVAFSVLKWNKDWDYDTLKDDIEPFIGELPSFIKD